MRQFGINLRLRARELSLSDAEVARRAGLSERRYGFYVTGDREPDLVTLQKIAKVLQSSIDDLLEPDAVRAAPDTAEERLRAELMSAAESLNDHYLELLRDIAIGFSKRVREEGRPVNLKAQVKYPPSRRKNSTKTKK